MQDLREFEFQKIAVGKLQLLCLLTVGIVEAIGILMGDYVKLPSVIFGAGVLNAAAALFLGVSISHPMSKTGRNVLLTGLAMCLWMLFLQIIDLHEISLLMEYRPRFAGSAAFCEYAMMLPFAVISDHQTRDKGMVVSGSLFLGASALVSVLGVMSVIGASTRDLWPIMQLYGISTLCLSWNPNVLAPIFLIGIGFSLAFACRVKKLGFKVTLCYLAVLEFILLSLTESLANILMACCIFGGILFFLIYHPGKYDGKHFLAAVLSAALTVLLLLAFSRLLVRLNTQRWIRIKNPPIVPNSLKMGVMTCDLGSFGGRTEIWLGCLKAVWHNPKVLIFGCKNVSELISPYLWFPFKHAHNSWLQALIVLGIPGFLVAICLTWLVLKNVWLLFFVKQSTLYQKVIAMLTIAIMAAQFLEVYIFYTEYPESYINLQFLFFTGYLVYWGETIPDLKPKKSLEYRELPIDILQK